MDGPWQDDQAPDRLATSADGALAQGALATGGPVASAPLANAPTESIAATRPAPAASTDSTPRQGKDIVYAPVDISGFRSPQLPKLMREFSPLATVVRRPGAGETATHALDMSDRRAEELAEQAKARSMHLVVLFEQMQTPDAASHAPQATQAAASPGAIV